MPSAARNNSNSTRLPHDEEAWRADLDVAAPRGGYYHPNATLPPELLRPKFAPLDVVNPPFLTIPSPIPNLRTSTPSHATDLTRVPPQRTHAIGLGVARNTAWCAPFRAKNALHSAFLLPSQRGEGCAAANGFTRWCDIPCRAFVNHQYKFIYVKHCKTAGTTVYTNFLKQQVSREKTGLGPVDSPLLHRTCRLRPRDRRRLNERPTVGAPGLPSTDLLQGQDGQGAAVQEVLRERPRAVRAAGDGEVAGGAPAAVGGLFDRRVRAQPVAPRRERLPVRTQRGGEHQLPRC
jgi:hypothetical protein